MKINDINSKDYNRSKQAMRELCDELEYYKRNNSVENCIEATERISKSLGIDIKLEFIEG
jgi:hypothetical protein